MSSNFGRWRDEQFLLFHRDVDVKLPQYVHSNDDFRDRATINEMLTRYAIFG